MSNKPKKIMNPVVYILVILICGGITLTLILNNPKEQDIEATISLPLEDSTMEECVGEIEEAEIADYLYVPGIKELISENLATFIAIGEQGILLWPDGNYEVLPYKAYEKIGFLNIPPDDQEFLLNNHQYYQGYFSCFDQVQYFGISLPSEYDPLPREVKEGNTDNPLYIEAVKEHLKTWYQIEDLPIMIQEVYEADLDGNGSMETIITAENIPKENYQDIIRYEEGEASDTSNIPFDSKIGHYRLILLLQEDGEKQEIYYDFRPIMRYYDGQLVYSDDMSTIMEVGFEPIENIYLYDNDGQPVKVFMQGIGDYWDYSRMDSFDRILAIWDLDDDDKMEVVFASHNYYQYYCVYKMEDNKLKSKCRFSFPNA